MEDMNINSNLLLLARNLRRVSQCDLAKNIGFDRSEYSRLESGFVKRTKLKIDHIATQLRFPPSFFFQEYELGEMPTTMQIRVKSPLRKRAFEQVFLDTSLRLFHLSLLENSPDSKLEADMIAGVDASKVLTTPARLATYFREKWGAQHGPLPGLVGLVKQSGIHVIGCLFDGPVEGITLKAGKSSYIFLNQNASVGTLRLALAREFYKIINVCSSIDRHEDSYSFALDLLAPISQLRESSKKIRDKEGLRLLAKRWMVPIDLIFETVIEANPSVQDQLKTSSKITARRDDRNDYSDVNAEYPITMAQIVWKDIERLGITKVLELLHCRLSDLEELYELNFK
jgi:transcriptional regulator with XRE-family HTH domain